MRIVNHKYHAIISSSRAAFVVALLSAYYLSPGAQAAPPPMEEFFRNSEIGQVAISPSGTQLAMAVTTAGNKHVQLAILNLDPLGKPKIIAGYVDADVQNIHWVNDTRLYYSAWDMESRVDWRSFGRFAINSDGTDERILPKRGGYFSSLDDGSADIIIGIGKGDGVGDFNNLTLERLNTTTGRTLPWSLGTPDFAYDYLLDAKGQLRVVTAGRDGKNTVYWRPGEEKTWQVLAEFKDYADDEITPALFDAQGNIYVYSTNGRDTSALYRFDTVTKKMEAEPLVEVPGFDLANGLVVDVKTRQLMGVRYSVEKDGTAWFDKDLRKIQLGIDSALPKGRSNYLYCGRCSATRYIVVFSHSDRQYGEYYVFDRKNSSLLRIGAARPWLNEAAQGSRSYQRVPARDGLSLPVYLTRPANAAADRALPAVVLVHGGPQTRGFSLSWEEDAQILASRGYLVIEPEFRGSTGYGTKHFHAGWKQWGLTMQDDLADAANWAIKQGFADPKKICIMGASYGGYAALMGPIRNPELYRCAVSYAAVTDIDLMFDLNWSDMSEEWKKYGMRQIVGDQKADADQFRATSPLRQVARIKVPVLLAHGSNDERVPIAHASKFYSAAKSAGVDVDWIVYKDEWHGWHRKDTNIDFWNKVEAFLAKSMDAKSP